MTPAPLFSLSSEFLQPYSIQCPGNACILEFVKLETAVCFETPVEIFGRVWRELKPRTPVPHVTVEYRKFANVNSSLRLENGRMAVKMSDLLEGAPTSIVEALAHILLSKLWRRAVAPVYADRYRRFLNRKEMRRSAHLIRQERGRKFISGARGEHYDLEAMFEELNLRHFHGLMARPRLGWTRRPSRMVLGHYDPSHNAIVMNRILDSPKVPAFAVEYVLFHEMLHLRHPVKHDGARRCVHTAEFKAAEREFPGFSEAKEILKNL